MREFATTLAATLALALVTFATNIVYARLLGPAGRGELTSVIAFSSTIAAVAQFGLAQASVYFARRRRLSGLFYPAAIGVVVIASATLTLALWNVIEVAIGLSLFLLICVASAVQSFFLALAQGRRDLVAFNLARLIAPVVAIMLFASAWWADKGTAEAAVIGLIAGAIVSIVPMLQQSRVAEPVRADDANEERLPAARLASQAAGFYAIAILGVITSYADKIFLTYHTTSAVLGIYAVAYGLSRVLGFAWQSASYSVYARFAGFGHDAQLDNVIGAIFRLALWPVLFATAATGAFGIVAIPLLFGAEFTGAVPVFAILAFEGTLGGMSWFIAQKFTTTGRPHLAFYRQAASLAVFFAGLPLVGKSNPAVDLAWVLLASAALRLVLSIWLYRRETGIALSFVPTAADFAFVRASFKASFTRGRAMPLPEDPT